MEEPGLRRLEAHRGAALGQETSVVDGQFERSGGLERRTCVVDEGDAPSLIVDQYVGNLGRRHTVQKVVVGDLVGTTRGEEAGEDQGGGHQTHDQPDSPPGPALILFSLWIRARGPIRSIHHGFQRTATL